MASALEQDWQQLRRNFFLSDDCSVHDVVGSEMTRAIFLSYYTPKHGSLGDGIPSFYLMFLWEFQRTLNVRDIGKHINHFCSF